MPQLQVKLYEHDKPKPPRIPQRIWNKHELRIRELHAARYTSEKARQVLRDETQASGNYFEPS